MYHNEHDYSIERISTDFMYKVYGWMSGALAVTALTAYTIAATPLSLMILTNKWLLIGMSILQIALVMALSFAIQRMSLTVASIAFVAYAILTGIVFSSIFIVFTQSSIASTFVVTAGMFGIMALYGYYTSSDLSTLGNILFMALIGLILSSLVNLFLQSPVFNYVISAVGVVIFTLLTAVDVQKLKLLSLNLLEEGEMRSKVALLGALTLYLDFINLFIMLLQFMGNRRQD